MKAVNWMNGSNARIRMVIGGLILLVAVATLLTAREFNERRDTDRDAAARNSALVTAKKAALGLSTIDEATITKSMASLLELSTGTFRDQLTSNQASQVQAVTKGKVISTGKIDSAGIANFDGDSAVVGIALTAKVSDAKTKKPQVNLYRMSVHLDREEDGKWLVSTLEFVQ
jgi:hypothetical protein